MSYCAKMRANTARVNTNKKANKKATEKTRKQYTGLRIMTRKIMRNKLKFELKKLGFPKVNKNFRQILSNMSDKEIIKLLNK